MMGLLHWKMCSYLKFWWSLFSRIRIEYGEIRSISPYSVQMWEKTDQKNSKYGHLSRSIKYWKINPFWLPKLKFFWFYTYLQLNFYNFITNNEVKWQNKTTFRNLAQNSRKLFIFSNSLPSSQVKRN